MKIEKNYALREIAGEHIIVPIGDTALEFNGLISVNDVGMFLWKLLQEETTKEDIVRKMLEEYDVDAETAERDSEEFIEKLQENGILK